MVEKKNSARFLEQIIEVMQVKLYLIYILKRLETPKSEIQKIKAHFPIALFCYFSIY